MTMEDSGLPLSLELSTTQSLSILQAFHPFKAAFNFLNKELDQIKSPVHCSAPQSCLHIQSVTIL